MRRFILAVMLSVLAMTVSVSAAANLAPDAAVEAVSSYSDAYDASFVKDGKILTPDARYPFWITDFESEASATITWAAAQSISRVVLYDLPSATENVISGSLKFSDGTSVNFGELDKTGAGTEVAKFDKPVSATSVTITVKCDEDTSSVGLAEAEFYDAAGTNVARAASGATATSVGWDGDISVWDHEYYTDGWYTPMNLYDGYFDVMSYEYCEWSSASDPMPTIKLSWPDKITIGTIVLYDRYNTSDNVVAGRIEFDNGTVVDFSGIDPMGRALYIDIPDVTAQSFTISVTESESVNIGFGEIEVYTEHYANGSFIENKPQVSAEPAGDEAAPETKAPATAPQTYDSIRVLAAVAVICTAASVIIRKKSA